MKKIIAVVRSIFAKHSYRATATIAGQLITFDVKAPSLSKAYDAADYIIDDCGFLISLSETN